MDKGKAGVDNDDRRGDGRIFLGGSSHYHEETRFLYLPVTIISVKRLLDPFSSSIPTPNIFKYKRYVLTLGTKEIGVRELKKLVLICDSPSKEITVFLNFCQRVVKRRVVVKGDFPIASGAMCGVLRRVVTYKEFIAAQTDSWCIACIHKINESTSDEDIACIKTALTEAP